MKQRRVKGLFAILKLALVALGLIFVSGVFLPQKAKALGDVTLSIGSFVDPDAEDTHEATQWVITRDGSGVFDSGEDLVNLTSIVVSSTFFTAGETYSWKARTKDQHGIWSAYSADSVFTYGSAPTPTPTSTPTSQPSSTSTVVPTATTTATATSVPETSKMHVQVLVPNGGETYQLGETAGFYYYAAARNNMSWNSCTQLGSWHHDLYLATNGNHNYSRIARDLDYSLNCIGDSGTFAPSWSARIAYSWTIPNDTSLITNDAYLVAVVYEEGNSLGESFIAPDGWSGSTGENVSTDRSDNPFSITGPGGVTPSPGPITTTPLPYGVEIKVPNPNHLSIWLVGETGPIEWQTIYTGVAAPQVEKVNVRLSKNSGRTYSEILNLQGANLGSMMAPVLERFITDTAKVKVEGFSATGTLVAIGESEVFRILGSPSCTGPGCGCTGQNCRCVGADCPPVKCTGAGPCIWQCVGPDCKCYGDCGCVGPSCCRGPNCECTSESCRCTGANCCTGPDCGCKKSKCHCTGPRCSCFGFNCRPGEGSNSLLLLGALAATLIPYLLAIIAALPALMSILIRLISYLTDLLNYLRFTFFSGKKKKEPKWGVVYDSKTKKPLAACAVRVYTAASGRLKGVKYTGKDGTFGFILPPGQYSLVVAKAGYKFPSSLITAKSDGEYHNIYREGEIEVKSVDQDAKSNQINVNIPLDTVGFSAVEAVAVTSKTFIVRFLDTIRLPLMALGTLLTIYLIVKFRWWVDYLILVVYLVLWLFELKRVLMPKNYGLIIDEKGRRVGRVLLRALDRAGKLKGTIVTGDDGKFNFTLNPGAYVFVASRNGYATSRTAKIRIDRLSDFRRVVIRIVRLKKVDGRK